MLQLVRMDSIPVLSETRPPAIAVPTRFPDCPFCQRLPSPCARCVTRGLVKYVEDNEADR
jgi:hypothetical protein